MSDWTMRRGPVYIRPSKFFDVGYMRDRIRQSDIDELDASFGETPEEALMNGMRDATLCQTVLLDAMPVAMFGTSPVADKRGVGVVWFLATTDLKQMWLPFLRMSRPCVKKMLEDFDLLFNYVDARNLESLGWLAWIGADIDASAPFGRLRLPFHFFTIRRENYV